MTTTKPQSPIERLREIAAEQAQLQGRARCTCDDIEYQVDPSGLLVCWRDMGQHSIEVDAIRLIAREILGMVEPGEVPAQPEPTESKQEPWGYAVLSAEHCGYILFKDPTTAAEFAKARGQNAAIPLYAAPVKATGWIVKDKDGRRVSAICHSEKEDAVGNIAKFDGNYPDHAPHRVVGLAEVTK